MPGTLAHDIATAIILAQGPYVTLDDGGDQAHAEVDRIEQIVAGELDATPVLEQRDILLLIETIDALFAMFDAVEPIGGVRLSPEVRRNVHGVRAKLRHSIAGV